MAKHSLHILGCAANGNIRGYATSGYLLKSGDDLTLFDCGGGVTAEFALQQFEFKHVKRIFISHTHPDHVSDLALFLQSIYLTGRKNALEIHVPFDFVTSFEAYCKALYLFSNKFPFDLKVVGYEKGHTVKDGKVKITAIGNNHLGKYAERVQTAGADNKMLAHSFLIEAGKKKVFYSADLATFEEAHPYLDACDVALVEASHIDFDSLLDAAEDNPDSEFIVIHLGSEDEIARLEVDIEDSELENITLAEPGRVVEL